MWGHMNSYGWGSMGLGMIGVSLFWILLIAALVLLVKNLWKNGDRSKHMPENNPLDILKERYARGEIDKTEFEQRKLDLES